MTRCQILSVRHQTCLNTNTMYNLVFQILSSILTPIFLIQFRKESCWYLAFYLIEWKYGEEQHQACWILNYNNTEEWCFDKFLTGHSNHWPSQSHNGDVIDCANITPTLARPGSDDLCLSSVRERERVGLTLRWWWSIAANNLIRTNTYYDCFCLQFWP